MMTLTKTLFFTCLLFLLGVNGAVAANVTAEVDTHKVQQGDSLTLTVTVDERAIGREPDFTELKEQFHVINKVQSSSVRMINGQMESSLSWRLTLVPKVLGYVVIPPIKYAKSQTKPITIQVTKHAASGKRSSKDLVFIEATLDKKEVYVQEQAILTLRLYRRTQLVDSTWTPPRIDDAVLERISDSRTYQSKVGNYTYQVTENSFAIFPQKSGTLEIPESTLTATIGTGVRGGFFFDPFSSNGKQIRRTTKPMQIEVKPIPDNYPNTPWLPSSAVALADQWSPENPEFKVGEAVTRTIILQAKGLTATALPSIPAPQSDKFKVYPDKADTESGVDADGILSQRVESYAFIPTEPGTVTLPEIQISWWDVTRDQLQTAVLPTRTIEVVGSANVQRTDQTVSAPPSIRSAELNPPPSMAIADTETVSTTWQWIAIIALALWLITLGLLLWVASKRKPSVIDSSEDKEAATIKLKEAKKQLKLACQQHDPIKAKSALVTWGKAMYPRQQCFSLGDVVNLVCSEKVGSEKCAAALKELETLLYRGQSDKNWDGTILWEAIEEVEADAKIKSADPALQPLYPAAS